MNPYVSPTGERQSGLVLCVCIVLGLLMIGILR